MKGTYNNQTRKSGGYKKSKILVGEVTTIKPISLPCTEARHGGCDGYLTFFPHLKGYKCLCDCHKNKKLLDSKPQSLQTEGEK